MACWWGGSDSLLFFLSAVRFGNKKQLRNPAAERHGPDRSVASATVISFPFQVRPLPSKAQNITSNARFTMNNGNTDGAVPHRILIILLGSIGDVVRALPLLGRLRKAYPDAHIAWAVEPKSAPVIEGHRWLDEMIIYNRARAPWSFPSFLYRVRAGHFDLVLDLQRHLKSGLIARVSGATDRLGFSAANTKEFNYRFSTRQVAAQPNMRLKLMQYQSFGDLLGIPAAPIEFGLEPTDNDL